MTVAMVSRSAFRSGYWFARLPGISTGSFSRSRNRGQSRNNAMAMRRPPRYPGRPWDRLGHCLPCRSRSIRKDSLNGGDNPWRIACPAENLQLIIGRLLVLRRVLLGQRLGVGTDDRIDGLAAIGMVKQVLMKD